MNDSLCLSRSWWHLEVVILKIKSFQSCDLAQIFFCVDLEKWTKAWHIFMHRKSERAVFISLDSSVTFRLLFSWVCVDSAGWQLWLVFFCVLFRFYCEALNHLTYSSAWCSQAPPSAPVAVVIEREPRVPQLPRGSSQLHSQRTRASLGESPTAGMSADWCCFLRFILSLHRFQCGMMAAGIWGGSDAAVIWPTLETGWELCRWQEGGDWTCTAPLGW